MARNRREEKERLREIRQEAEHREASEQRRKLLAGYAVAGVLGAAVVIGIVLVVISSGGGGASGNAHIVNLGVGEFTTTQELEPDGREGTETKPGALAEAAKLQQAARAAKCVLRSPTDEGATHLTPDQQTPKYKSDPPTSGNHDPIPLANGVYASPLTDFRHAVHSLEHGRVQLQYQPDLPEPAQLKLKGVVDEDFRDVTMFQNSEMEWEVAATAWGQLLGCEAYNDKALDAIHAFRDSYRDRGPEPTTSQPS